MLKSPHRKLINSLRHLEQSLDTLQKSRNNSVFYAAAQKACIERFENSFDSFLRFSQLYMKHQYDVEIFDDPDSVFNFYAQFNICSYEDKSILCAMIADRQHSPAIKDTNTVDALTFRIEQYHLVMSKIACAITIGE